MSLISNPVSISLSITSCILLLLSLSSTASAKNGILQGEGTLESPFSIEDYEDLKQIHYDLDAHYRLSNSIDASQSAVENEGKGFMPFGDTGEYLSQIDTNGFSGSLNGANYEIQNITISRPEDNYLGLFLSLKESAIIDSLHITDFSLTVHNHGGCITANNMGLIRNSSCQGSVIANYGAGGFIHQSSGIIENSSFEGASSQAGFIFLNEGQIDNSTAVSIKNECSENSGSLDEDYSGFVHENSGIIKNSQTTGTYNCAENHITGFVNKNDSLIEQCTQDITVLSAKSAYGFFSRNYGTIQNAHNTSTLKNNWAYGFGNENYGLVELCTNSGDIHSSHSIAIGFIRTNYGTIKKSRNHGAVKGTNSNAYIAGGMTSGFVSHNHGHILESINSGAVTELGSSTHTGFVFSNERDSESLLQPIISKSMNLGDVIGGKGSSAGFIGHNEALIEQSITIGKIEGGKYTSGFGEYNSGTIRNSYSMSTSRNGISAIHTNEGSVDHLYWHNALPSTDSTAEGIPLSKQDFTMAHSFEGFDFDSIWDIREGLSYPYLRALNNPPLLQSVTLNTKGKEIIIKNYQLIDLDSSASSEEYMVKILENTHYNALGDSLIISILPGEITDTDTLWGPVYSQGIPLIKSISIDEYTDLLKIGTRWDYPLDADYSLSRDIDASESQDSHTFKPIGPLYTTPFTGSFDGNGYTIFNLSIRTYSVHPTGLFGYIAYNATVTNLNLMNVSIEGTTAVGGLAGESQGIIQQVTVSGSVTGTGNSVGGIVGLHTGPRSYLYVTDSKIKTMVSVRFSGAVSGTVAVGGIVGLGLQNAPYVYDAHSSGTVRGTSAIGGIAGRFYGRISHSLSTSDVEGTGIAVGGIVGVSISFNNDTYLIDQCYSTGTIKGMGSVGGIIGGPTMSRDLFDLSKKYGLVMQSYSIASISGDTLIGGIVGSSYWREYLNTFHVVDTTLTTPLRLFGGGPHFAPFDYYSNTVTIDGMKQADGTVDLPFSISDAPMWEYSEDASYLLLTEVLDAPFALSDTLIQKETIDLHVLTHNDFNNDFDSLTIRAEQLTGIGSIDTVLNEYLFNESATEGSVDTLYYRVGGVIDSDTTWGNRSKAFIIYGDKEESPTDTLVTTDPKDIHSDSTQDNTVTSLAPTQYPGSAWLSVHCSTDGSTQCTLFNLLGQKVSNGIHTRGSFFSITDGHAETIPFKE